MYDMNDKKGGYGKAGKKVDNNSKSGKKQWKQSLNHAAGVGNQKGLERLTVQEMRGTTARKKLLAKKEKELVELSKRVERAEAKKNAMYTPQRTPRRKK